MNFKLTKSDLQLAGVFFLLSVIIGCMDYDMYEEGEGYLLFWDNFNYVLFASFSVYVLVFVIFATFFPKKQFLRLFFFGILFLFFMGYLEVEWYCYFYFEDCKDGNRYSLSSLYSGFISHIDGVGIFATFILGKKLYDAQAHFLTVEKEKKEAELRFLKSQIDPHFLFNNLNTIDSLIDSNPKRAKIYLNKLSQLYRYLISSKDFEVVPLEDELEFAQNYMYLIESRYGDAYLFEIKNKITGSNNFLIPPGALQTLLENIVKHNHGSSSAPIKTNINITNKTITVSNNIKAKNGRVDSTGIGLTNLKARYQLLTDQDILIESNEDFIVKLPTIKEVA
ncbi:MAG TPA: histidine kinase [Phaeodactylibacter sp.]|nr:histidine kinase [Phaeodactylibacter sp.]